MKDVVEQMADEFKLAYPLTYDCIYRRGIENAIEELIHILKYTNTTICKTGYEYHGYSDDELGEIAEQLRKK